MDIIYGGKRRCVSVRMGIMVTLWEKHPRLAVGFEKCRFAVHETDGDFST